MSNRIDYGNLMHDAMRGLIRKVLTDVSENGLPGSHHFFISFGTEHPEVQIADWLRDRYPDEMTVVLQHWFENLDVGEDGFAVTLNFGDSPEPLYIPYDAIHTFVDPSVEFGLRFETQGNVDDDDDLDDYDDDLDEMGDHEVVDMGNREDSGHKAEPKGEAEVVSLDSFRK